MCIYAHVPKLEMWMDATVPQKIPATYVREIREDKMFKWRKHLDVFARQATQVEGKAIKSGTFNPGGIVSH